MKKFIETYSKKPDRLFKTLFVTFLFGYLPFAILHMVLNLAHIIPVNFNDGQIYGWKGVLIIILFIPFIVGMITIYTWCFFMIGNLVLRLLRALFYSGSCKLSMSTSGIDLGFAENGEKADKAAAASSESSNPKKTKSQSSGGFGTGVKDGFESGVEDTLDFFSSLTSTQGWENLGRGALEALKHLCGACPGTTEMNAELAENWMNYIQNIPNMSPYALGYDIGYGTEKILETAVTRGITTGAGVGVGSVRILSNTSKQGTTLLKTDKNFRIDLDIKNGLHYHRRGPGGIGRHRPWQVKPGDKGKFMKRF